MPWRHERPTVRSPLTPNICSRIASPRPIPWPYSTTTSTDMSSAPGPTSRTPLLAAQQSAQQASSQATTSTSTPATRPTRSLSPSPANVRPSHSPNVSFIRRRRRKRSPQVHTFPAVVTTAILAFVIFVAWDVSSYGNCYFRSLCSALGEGERLDSVWWENSGAYAPWRSGGPGGGKRGLPRGCEINQVTLVRFPLCFTRDTMGQFEEHAGGKVTCSYTDMRRGILRRQPVIVCKKPLTRLQTGRSRFQGEGQNWLF